MGETIDRTGSWTPVVLWTVFGTLGCVLAACAYDILKHYNETGALTISAVESGSIILPIALATPLLFYFSSTVRALKQARKQLTHIASTDMLTGCLNRRAFFRAVEDYLESRKNGEKPKGAFLVIDADNFKTINDSFGHDRGDWALQLIATAIGSQLGPRDRLARIGGEEFAALLPDISLEAARLVAEHIRMAVRRADFEPEGTPYQLSVSIGVAVFEGPIIFATLYQDADRRLYRAKELGRNRVDIGMYSQNGTPELSVTLH